jgi:hypothetical protein
MYKVITVKNISDEVVSYTPVTIPADYTLTVFDVEDNTTFGYATVLLKNYPAEVFRDFTEGNIEIIVDGILITTTLELDQVYTAFGNAFRLHQVGFYADTSPFHFDMDTKEWVCRNPIDGKQYSITLTERI